MDWVRFMIISFLFILLIIFISNIRISIRWRRDGKNDMIIIKLKALFGLIRIQKEIPILTLEDTLSGFSLHFDTVHEQNSENGSSSTMITPPEVKKNWRNWKELVDQYRDVIPYFRRLLRIIYIKKLDWRTSVGTGEAAETGTITGSIWNIKALVITVISQYLTMDTQPRYDVRAHFSEPLFHTEGECILQISVGKATFVAIGALKSLRKGRERKWQNIQSKA